MRRIQAKFQELAQLKTGWHNGEGVALDPERLQIVCAQFLVRWPRVPEPSLFPTVEGNLLFEWKTAGGPSVDLELATMKAEFHMFSSSGDIERDFMLCDAPSWDEFFRFLIDHVGSV
jgi:hypothetical protein